MAFWKKETKEEKKEEEKPIPPKPVEELPKIELGEIPQRPHFAPLFVKINRYREVLKTIENLKSILLGLKDLLDVMQQLDKIRSDSKNLLQKNIQELLKNVAALDKEFVRPKGIETEQIVPMGAERVESYVDELQREIDNLKSQLQRMD